MNRLSEFLSQSYRENMNIQMLAIMA